MSHNPSASDDAAPVREPFYRNVARHDLPPVHRYPVHVVLDNIRSAFNVGSIFRTADAGGVEHIHLCGMSAYPPSPKLAKTALGAHEYVPWTHYKTTNLALEALHALGIPCVAIEVTPNAVAHTQFNWPQPVAIVFGNEVRGISPDILSQCDAAVCIPMCGLKNTINVATAFGVILFQLLHHWRAI